MPGLDATMFLLPAEFSGRREKSGVKNRDEGLVVLNSMAKSIIEKQRGISREWVFPYNGTAMHRMNDLAWKKARVRSGETLAGGKPSPRSPRVCVDQSARPQAHVRPAASCGRRH